MKRSDSAILKLLNEDLQLFHRYKRVRDIARNVRVSEYHLTNACNIRCKGCWFFEYGFDKGNKENTDQNKLRDFLNQERARGINSALVIGGEPTLFPARLKAFTEIMEYVTVSTNGLVKLPIQEFPSVAVLISLFGGGPLDDALRAIRPNKSTFTGLFDTALENYYKDPRACFVFAITEDGIDYIEETVDRIHKNHNRVTFNFYSKYGTESPLYQKNRQRLLDEALRVKALYPTTVLSHPYYIRSVITGESHWGKFSYSVCPSISSDHPAHKERLLNGNPVLPKFNAWAADLNTVNFCCTSGHCEGCQDSQAILSWLLMNVHKFRNDPDLFATWIELSESYWKQFCWADACDALKDDDTAQQELLVPG